MADIFPYWRINGGNKNNETVTGGIFIAEIVLKSTAVVLFKLYRLDGQELRNRQQNILAKMLW